MEDRRADQRDRDRFAGTLWRGGLVLTGPRGCGTEPDQHATAIPYTVTREYRDCLTYSRAFRNAGGCGDAPTYDYSNEQRESDNNSYHTSNTHSHACAASDYAADQYCSFDAGSAAQRSTRQSLAHFPDRRITK